MSRLLLINSFVVFSLLTGCAQSEFKSTDEQKKKVSQSKPAIDAAKNEEDSRPPVKINSDYLAGYFTNDFQIKSEQDKKADQLCRQAVKALQHGDHQKANAHLSKSKEVAPDSFVTWYTIGFVEFGRRAYRKALFAFSKATTIDSKDYDAYDGLGRSYYRLKDYDHARHALQKAVALKPRYYLGHMNLGIVAMDTGRAKEARARLEKACKLAKNESAPEPEYWLGYYYHGYKKYDKAVEHYKKALAIDKNDSRSLNMMAKAYSRLGKFDEAINIFTQLRDLYPKRLQYYGNLAEIEEDRGNWKKAIAHYDRYNKLNPKSELGLVQQGHQYLVCHQFKEARAKFEAAKKINPKSGYVYNGLGNCAINFYKFKEAARFHEIAVSYNPKSDVFWNNLGLDYMFLPDSLLDARRALERAYQLNPQGETILSNLSSVYRKMGEVKKATALAIQCLKVKPNSIKGFVALSSVRIIQGKYDSAEKLASTAIGIDPKNAEIWHIRGLAFYKQGKLDKAERDWKKSVELHPRLHQAWSSLAELYDKKKDKKKKTFALKQAIKAKKGMTAGELYRDAFALEQLGEFGSSAGAFGEGLTMDPAEADVLLNLPIPKKDKEAMQK